MKLKCYVCGEEKPAGNFSNGEQRRTGYRRCRECVRKYNAEHYTPRARSEEYRVKARAAQSAKIKNNPRWAKNKYFKYRYGLTFDQIEQIAEQQSHLCAICHKPETHVNPKSGEVQFLTVDHRASDGKFRGLVCRRCNFLLGNAREDVDILRSAIKYLIERP